VGRVRVAARGVGVRARVVRAAEAAIADRVAMLPPAFREVWMERPTRFQVGMDVAVDDRELALLVCDWRLQCGDHARPPGSLQSIKAAGVLTQDLAPHAVWQS